jgi:hypothetical protein
LAKYDIYFQNLFFEMSVDEMSKRLILTFSATLKCYSHVNAFTSDHLHFFGFALLLLCVHSNNTWHFVCTFPVLPSPAFLVWHILWQINYVAKICGNQAFPEMPGFSSIALAFAENFIYLTLFTSGKWNSISRKLTIN